MAEAAGGSGGAGQIAAGAGGRAASDPLEREPMTYSPSATQLVEGLTGGLTL